MKFFDKLGAAKRAFIASAGLAVALPVLTALFQSAPPLTSQAEVPERRVIDLYAQALAQNGDDPRLQKVWADHQRSIAGLAEPMATSLQNYATYALENAMRPIAAVPQPTTAFNKFSGAAAAPNDNRVFTVPTLKFDFQG